MAPETLSVSAEEMTVEEVQLKNSVIRGVAEVLGETSGGLTKTEITRLLAELGIPDPNRDDPNGMFYVSINKRDRLEQALLAQCKRDGQAICVLKFVKKALDPARYGNRPDQFEYLRTEVNVSLAFEGLVVTDDGRIKHKKKAATLSDARETALDFKRKLRDRGTHQRLLDACVEEIDDNNYFHATLEAAKSLTTEIVRRSGVEKDGHELVDAVFEKGKRDYPIMVLNRLETETERARQRGLATGLKSIFSSYRNPIAHEPRSLGNVSEQDALDAFGWMSHLHRRLDDCHVTVTPSLD